MAEKLIYVKEDRTDNVNYLLEDGYKVKNIIPIHESVAGSNASVRGNFGAYVVLTKE